MADITDQHDQNSPSALDEHAVGNGNQIAGSDTRGIKRPRPATADDDDDDDDKPGRERRKIEIKKAGIMKKAYELSVLTGTQVLLLVVSETGLVYTFTTPKLQPLVTKAEGKNLIQACLNAPEPTGNGENGVDDGKYRRITRRANSTAFTATAARSSRHATNRCRKCIQVMVMYKGYRRKQQQALAYQNYMAHQQRGGYMPPQAGIPQQQAHQS
ncbi:hypothetical protein EYC84_000757 [Monilinia fructicola]|uniref:MADS-box domain-containing protein n=1 Tax=Monilinia fructicola TaxID=38448 RepID=A0A5M9JK22_MONFR|nr:hypothetical protein EYC84_000757 [Monilinia fructicola]